MTCFSWLAESGTKERAGHRTGPLGFRTKVKPVSGTLSFYQAGEGRSGFRAARGLRETEQMSRPRFCEKGLWKHWDGCLHRLSYLHRFHAEVAAFAVAAQGGSGGVLPCPRSES